MATTASVYINKINQEYPVAGQDNDSQGFRDNFKNIRLALNDTDGRISSLEINAVRTNSTSTDLGNQIFQRVVLKDYSVKIVETNLYPGVPLDYRDGNYQKITVGSGDHNVSVSNWPTSNKTGRLTLEVKTTENCTVNFYALGGGQIFNFGGLLPAILSGGLNYIFELWNVGNDVYIEQLLAPTNAESSIPTDLRIGTNRYTTGTTAGSLFATVVTDGSRLGNLALVPNVVSAVVVDQEVDSPGSAGATKIALDSVYGIKPGARLVSTVTNNVYTVTNTTSTGVINYVQVTPSYTTDPTEFATGSSIIFTNPQFTDQPTVVTFRSAAPTNTSGGPTDLKGQIYANSSTLWVAYDNYTGSKNWFKIESNTGASLGISGTVSENTTGTAATTAWVHSVLPYGSIIMWYGSTSDVPVGWALCNGANGTPDLRDRFVVGAGTTYSAGTTGGSADAVVVSHSHSASSNDTGGHSHSLTLSGGDHTHTLPASSVDNQDPGQAFGSNWVTDGHNVTTPSGGGHSHTGTADTAGSHSHSISVSSTGVSGTNANLPPYYALCFIMKVTGS